MNHDLDSKDQERERGITIQSRSFGKTQALRKAIDNRIEQLDFERAAIKLDVNSNYGTQAKSADMLEAQYKKYHDIKDEIKLLKEERRKLEPGVAIVGHVDHGRTTLTAAITHALSQHKHDIVTVSSEDSIETKNNESSLDSIQKSLQEIIDEGTAFKIHNTYNTDYELSESKMQNICNRALHRQAPKNIAKKVKAKRKQAKQSRAKARKSRK